jgi:ferredoxin
MYVTADRNRCMGSGACVFEAPEVFTQDEQGVVVLLTERPDEIHREAVLAAVDACPVLCIEAEDTEAST